MPATAPIPLEENHLQARLDARKRKHDIFVSRLRRTSIFNQLVKRFVEGESVAQVATWVYYLKPEGPLKEAAYHTIREYLTALRMRVRNEVADRLEKRREKVVEETAPIPHEEVAQVIREAPLPPPPHVTDDITKLVDKAVRSIDSGTMLKYTFMVQKDRVKRLLALESSANGMLHPNGYREIDVLKSIAEAVRKFEVGEEIIRNRNLYNTLLPPAGTITPEPGDLVEQFNQLDEVDRNLIVAATEKMVDGVIDMVREESGAGFKAGGLGEADSGTRQPQAGTD
jgi:hypothetical protein